MSYLVPKGSILSPIISLVHLNGLRPQCTEILAKVLLYRCREAVGLVCADLLDAGDNYEAVSCTEILAKVLYRCQEAVEMICTDLLVAGDKYEAVSCTEILAKVLYRCQEAVGLICADLLVAGDKYEAVSVDNGYNKYMMLKIRGVSRQDFGSYQCVAKNSLGETDGVIKLDEIPAPSTTTTSTAITPVVPSVKKKIKTNKMKGKQGKQRLSENQVLGDYDSSSNAEWHAPGDYGDGFSSKGPPLGLDSGTTLSWGSSSFPLHIVLGVGVLLLR
ncbi:hypothetical protein J6590_014430 [Homalodisca vitripennis]|nr:hypothetical protein J6590_014430 [Homalodisca vitripennis]